MAITNTLGFTASHRLRSPYGPYIVGRIHGGATMALLPVSYGELSRSQWRCPANTISEQTPRLEVRQSEGRGHGLFAVDRIPAFSRILEDHALLSMSHGEDLPQLWEKYCTLPREDRKRFDELSPPAYQIDKEARIVQKLQERGWDKRTADRAVRVSSTFQGNAFNIGMNGGDWTHGYALFPTVARINHSCTPNAFSHYRATSDANYVYALRDIEVGEEIEIPYFFHTLPLAERRHRTKGWSFPCKCPACSQELGSSYESKIALVHRFSDVNARPAPGAGDLQRIRDTVTFAESEERPWLRVSLPRVYITLGAVMQQAGAGEEAGVDAFRAAALWQDRTTGADSPQSFFMKRDLRTGEVVL